MKVARDKEKHMTRKVRVAGWMAWKGAKEAVVGRETHMIRMVCVEVVVEPEGLANLKAQECSSWRGRCTMAALRCFLFETVESDQLPGRE